MAVPDTALAYRNGVRVGLADLVAGDRIGVAGLKKTDDSLQVSRVLAVAPARCRSARSARSVPSTLLRPP